MSKRTQPLWSPPERAGDVRLCLFNSLTRKKEEFVPQFKNRVLWYSCGPTVYDAAHMGHARSYISFDILRRVLSDYFGYDVLYVMNITDIDDKIIKRARQNYLYDGYVKANHKSKQVLQDFQSIVQLFEDTIKKTTDSDKRKMYESMCSRVKLAYNEAKKNSENSETLRTLLVQGKDPLSEWLDKKYGGSVTEHSIFSKLSQLYEDEYHRDMDSLNVLRPSVLTRVSEYIPEIVDFIKKIISNGLAYESNGSVYFDVKKFDDADKHHYAKLVPEAFGDTSSLQEGEGDLSVTEEKLSEKKSPNDFALWKSSKSGEPWWESPWGKGRPGWHIECSVMASAICGESLDIHTGGVDLKFPHHDNELAQAEAYFGNDHWVRYFLHSGHLTITGCKMSKSLKNFITIQEALKKHTSRQLRLAFLLHSWKDTLDYSDTTMDMAMQYEKFLNEFFLNVKCLIRENNNKTAFNAFKKWTEVEINLNNKFCNVKDQVHNALCDNIDTRTVLDVIRDLVTGCNIYTKEVKNINVMLLQDVAIYVTKIFTVFGAISSKKEDIGFPLDSEVSNVNVEETILPYVEILSNFRDKVRIQARTCKIPNGTPKEAMEILKECDKLRDEILPNMGIRLEDEEGSRTKVKLVNKEELLKEKESKKQLEMAKLAEKEKRKTEAAAAAAAKEAQKKMSPKEMFKLEKDKYSQFDDNGLPTHDIDGKEISKGQWKKLQKLQQAQEKRYKEYLATLETNGAS